MICLRPFFIIPPLLLASSVAYAQPTETAEQRTARLAQYDVWQKAAAARYGIPWLLAKAVRVKESFNDPVHVSTTGAVGLMQLMPFGAGKIHRTANFRHYLRARRSKSGRHRGHRHTHWAAAYRQDLQQLQRKKTHAQLILIDQRFDPRWNIVRGTAYLAGIRARFARRHPRASPRDLMIMTLAGYYAGPGRVRYRRGKVLLPPFRTGVYVEDTMKVYGRLKAGLPGR